MTAKAAKEPTVTCGIFLFSIRTQKMLVCHATHASWKTWSIPKGLKETGEDPYLAAWREVKEETGLGMDDVNLVEVHALDPVKYAKQNKLLESFLVITDTDLEDLKLQCSTMVNDQFAEVDAWRWIAPGDAHKYLHESQLQCIPAIERLIAGRQ